MRKNETEMADELRARETIQRALGIIEGVACGLGNNAASMSLTTAVEMIDEVMNGGDRNA